MWSKIILNPKKDNLENGFLKPEYPFKHIFFKYYYWYMYVCVYIYMYILVYRYMYIYICILYHYSQCSRWILPTLLQSFTTRVWPSLKTLSLLWRKQAFHSLRSVDLFITPLQNFQGMADLNLSTVFCFCWFVDLQ